MSAGILWLSVLFIQIGGEPGKLIARDKHTDALGKALKNFPVSLSIPCLVAAAFLIGAVANTLIFAGQRALGRWLLKALDAIGGEFRPGGIQRRPRVFLPLYRTLRRLYMACEPVSITARSLVADTVESALGKAKVPGEAAMMYPISHAMDQTRYSGPQLAVTAPTLYQEFDRAKAEAELRFAIASPVLVLSIISPLQNKTWIFLAVLIGCTVLIAQALVQQRAANNILANAAYLNQIPLPAVQSLSDYIKDMENKPRSAAEWLGALMWAMEQLAQLEEAEDMAREVAMLEDQDMAFEALAYLIRRQARSHYLAMEVLRRLNTPYSKMLLGRLLAVTRHPHEKENAIPRLGE
jgi:hypothetical protein